MGPFGWSYSQHWKTEKSIVVLSVFKNISDRACARCDDAIRRKDSAQMDMGNVGTNCFDSDGTLNCVQYSYSLTYVVDWNARLFEDPVEVCYVSVDGTDCPISEPSPWCSAWYSHKINAAAVRYDVGVGVQSGRLLWIHGPFPAGSHSDLTIFRCGLKNFMGSNECVIGDSGYLDSRCLQPPHPGHPLHRPFSRIRARHEIVN